MKNIKNIICLLLVAMTFGSCDNFLSDRPSKTAGVVPSTYEDLEMILASVWRSDNISYHLVYATGDVELSAELEKMRSGSYSVQTVQNATWEREMSGTYKDYLWMYRYQNIFRSNLADEVAATIELTEEERTRIAAKAAYRRAFSYMTLLEAYTLPYSSATLNEMGLPLTKQTGFSYDIARATLEETYNFVEQDILTALTIDVKLENVAGQGSIYRVTDAAANALAARFYLMKHDYANAKKYAEAALALYGTDKIMDYNAIGYHSNVEYFEYDKDGDGVKENLEIKYPSTYTGYNATTDWTESYFVATVGGAFSGGYSNDNVVSDTHAAYFDSDGGREYDARYKYFYVENYTYLNGRNIDKLYFMKPAEYYMSVPEILLIAAECEARAGDWNKAVQYVNQLRAKRVDPTSPMVSLSASSKDEAIMMVIREKRREVGPHKQLFDVRRYNSNDYAADDVTVTQNFYSYTNSVVDVSSAVKEYKLTPTDRRWAAMIPTGDISSSNGVIIQNTY